MDTGTLKDLLNSGKTPEEINAILSGSTVSSGTLDPNFMAGEPYMPPQQMPMPQNYIRNERTGATYDMGQSQPSGPALDYSSPIEIGGQGKGYRLKGDASRVMLQDGRMFDLGRDTVAERARILEDMKIAKARQELEQGGVESQLKRAQLAELMGQDPAMMAQGMTAIGGQAPQVSAPVIPQGQPAPSSGNADPMLSALRQKFLQRRFGNPPPGERWDEQGRAIPIPGHQKDLGEGQKKQVLGVQNLGSAIDEYRAELAGWSGVDALSPDKRAGMGVKYNNMMLQAKEAYNLGVLNGPDFAILTSVITDPRSLTGAITSNEAMDKQASELKRIMQKVGSNVSNSRPSVAPPDASQKAKTVVRTGTANGRKVVQYSDGSVDYAP